MILSEKIQELSEIWGKIVGIDHHKDKDIRFYITEEYSFGNLIYRTEHFAYIGDDFNQSFQTKRAAQEYLCRELIRQIEEQILFNIQRCNDPSDESDMPLDYWLSLQKTFELVRNIECSDSPPQINYEELYLEIKKKHEQQVYHENLCLDILDKHGIPKCDENYPEIEYSINYRVEKLIEKLRNK